MGPKSRFSRRFCFGSALLLSLAASTVAGTGCGRWPQARTYQVETTAEPSASFQAVEEVVQARNYQVIERDEAARTLKLRTHIDENSSSRISHITIQVNGVGNVSLTPSGFLVRNDGTIHQRLDDEVASLESAIADRLGQVAASDSSDAPTTEAGPAPATAAPATAAPAIASGATPRAWVEPSSDPAKWGPGNFTCLPVHIPVADQPLIGLRLANGELANVTLSLAYDAALCRSPAACAAPGECPALGIGDEQQVEALARRLAAQEIAKTATLLHRGKPAALIDLSQHGSIAQAMGRAPSGQ